MSIWSEPPGGFMAERLQQHRRRRMRAVLRVVVVAGVATAIVIGIGGHRWITTLTPVDREEAVRLFQQELDDRFGEGADPDAGPRTSPRGKDKRARSPQRGNKQQASPGGLRQVPPRSGAQSRAAAPERRRESRSPDNPLPEEGVYSWDTRGYERVGGARRSFPRESQRIVRRDGRGWRQHHYFSKEREIWTHFRVSKRGAAISYQRNKVVVGPVTSDSEIDFSPPMLAAPSSLRVGHAWEGRWSGDTYGSYRGRTFERRHMNIAGTKVEVFGIHLQMRMQGEIRGEVEARVWLAPDYGMTVRERFVQDVRTSMGSYYAEWSMTAKSLRPRQ